jgi:hypothetical protein
MSELDPMEAAAVRAREEIAGDQIIDNREQRRRTAIGALDGKAANEAEVKFWAEEHERYRGDF